MCGYVPSFIRDSRSNAVSKIYMYLLSLFYRHLPRRAWDQYQNETLDHIAFRVRNSDVGFSSQAIAKRILCQSVIGESPGRVYCNNAGGGPHIFVQAVTPFPVVYIPQIWRENRHATDANNHIVSKTLSMLEPLAARTSKIK